MLIINKINLKEELFPINSSENTIEKHVSILKESTTNLMIIAAHSGIGPLAYFQELDKLELNDEITIYKDTLKETALEAENIPLDIIYEDNDILVVNKPENIFLPCIHYVFPMYLHWE